MKKEETIILNSIQEDNKEFNDSDKCKSTDNEKSGVSAVSKSVTDNEVTPPLKRSETLEGKLWKFKRDSSGIISEIRKREAYDKPSVKRKKKSKEARRRKKTFRFNNNFR